MAGRIPRQSLATCAAAVVLALLATGADQPLTPEQRAVMDHISADSLRGHLSFLASDLLEGRATPSRGLDLAAEYVAAQFRRAGLEPAGDDGYFQTATLADFGTRGAQVAQSLGVDDPSSVKMRNVAGILRGSDPGLRDTYVLLTAHYDHVGLARTGEDRIFNGANDDGSGTVSVVELAAALAAMPVHPRRSILFMVFFGEERDLWGSRYYAAHPLVPPVQTIAALNLEQVGRTDDSEGPQVRTATITGYDFSEVPDIFADAARGAGIRVYKHPKNSDPYFSRSDNQALADLGIPAHTLGVAFEFPDYHKVSDSWDKIDYDNMAAVDRAVALGMLRLASDAPAPKWNDRYGPARRYVDAGHRLHPQAP
jgi:Zn-dependent M28 family amino/carboxypeptidase